jgi:AraC family transcriptional regulator
MQTTNMFLGNEQVTKIVDGSAISLTTYSGNMEFEEWHAHEQCSISFLIHGNYIEEFAGVESKRKVGNIKFIHAGELHRCHHYADDTKKINLALSTQQLATANISETYLYDLVKSSADAPLKLIRLYREAVHNINEPPGSQSILLYQLIAKPIVTKISKTIPCWVIMLSELLQDEWQNQFTLKELSLKVGVHPVTISKMFPHYFSSTLSRYIQKIKVQKALIMIRISSEPLTRIAYSCGFADQGHFTRTFKEVTGFLPKDFRKL